MALSGVDISSYQGSLDLSSISYDFVAIKATEGTSYVNPSCDTHYQAAKANGRKRAIYHFYDFSVDPISQANYFVDQTAGYIRDAIFVLDWEGKGVEQVDQALAFLQQVEKRIGYKPAIYMSEYVENSYDWSAVVTGNYGLWLAKYANYEIENNYDMSGAGTPPVCTHLPFYFMWQWTSKGHLNGYAGDLDCDIAYLTTAQWDLYAGYQEPVVSPVVTPVAPAQTTDPGPTTPPQASPVPPAPAQTGNDPAPQPTPTSDPQAGPAVAVPAQPSPTPVTPVTPVVEAPVNQFYRFVAFLLSLLRTLLKRNKG